MDKSERGRNSLVVNGSSYLTFFDTLAIFRHISLACPCLRFYACVWLPRLSDDCSLEVV